MTTDLATAPQVDIAVLEQACAPQELAWVNAFLGPAHGNATEACRMVGYTGNTHALGVQGWRMCNNVNIAALVRAHMTLLGITRDKLILQLAAILDGDAFDQDGNPDMRLIKRKSTTHAQGMTSTSYEAYDKLEAIKLGMKYMGMLTSQVHVQKDMVLRVDLSSLSPGYPQSIDADYTDLSTDPPAKEATEDTTDSSTPRD